MVSPNYPAKFLKLFEEAEARNPRSAQRRIGPSGIGEDCIHCLGCMLAGYQQTDVENDYFWARLKGTLLHEFAQKTMERENEKQPGQYLIEQRVTVGQIRGTNITGTLDLLDIPEKCVVDWKFVGSNTLKKVKQGVIGGTYRVQPQAYGVGAVALGYEVENTMLLFIPVEEPHLKNAFPYIRPFDPAIVETALNRCNDIAQLIEDRGAEYVIPRLRRKDRCFNCARYPL